VGANIINSGYALYARPCPPKSVCVLIIHPCNAACNLGRKQQTNRTARNINRKSIPPLPLCFSQTFLDEQVHHNPQYRTNPKSLLDSRDSQGATPLILASRAGHYQVAELLVQRGASIEAQTPNARGGTALHEAVRHRNGHLIELLVRHGASPFVENAKSFTPMDFACEAQGADLLRSLESRALWRGWLLQKVPRLAGLGSEWERRWVVVCPRIPSPYAPPDRRATHIVLLCYKSTNATHPLCRAWLDGAKAEEAEHPRAAERTQGRRPAQTRIKLHRRHPAPSGAHVTGNNREGFGIHFRPDSGSQQDCAELAAFMNTVNRRAVNQQTSSSHAVGATLSPSPPAAAAGTQASPSPYPSVASASATSASAAATPHADEALARRLQEEADAELAQRLARLGSGRLSEVTPSAPPASASMVSSMPNRTPISQPSADVGAFFPSINFFEDAAAAAAAPPRPVSGAGAAANNGRPIFGIPAAATGAGTSGAAAPQREPSTMTTASSNASSEEENRCCICLDNKIDTGFQHKETTHVCVCYTCAMDIMRQAGPRPAACPKCRQPVERVTRVYFG
jgi:hypothetical protein